MNIREGFTEYFLENIDKSDNFDVRFNNEDNLIIEFKFDKGSVLIQEQANKMYCKTIYGYTLLISKTKKVNNLIKQYSKKDA